MIRPDDVLRYAFGQLRANLLRSFFTLLGIMVSVGFLVAVEASISGMNAYVQENIADAMIGVYSFQVRKSPLSIGLFDDEELLRTRRFPRISEDDAQAVKSTPSPTRSPSRCKVGYPSAPVRHELASGRDRGQRDPCSEVTPDFQVVQDLRVTKGRPLQELDVRERRPVVVIGDR